MSASSEYLVSELSFQSSVEKAEYGVSEGKAASVKWTQVWLGAIALSLFLLLVVTTEPVWLVLIGPFLVIGVSRLMGLESLWKDGDDEK